MNETKAATYANFVLPPSVVSKIDVSRIVGELEQLDAQMTSAAVRAEAGGQEQTRPVLSEQLTDFLIQNKLDVSNSKIRSALVKQMRLLKDKVPVVHMTFAVTADPTSLQQIVQWLRINTHPQAVISVGLQPTLVAGVYLRTPNHIHDLSLRAKIEGSHDILVKELEALRGSS